jgi:hypothetical protein
MRNLTVVACSGLFAGLAWAQPSPVAEKQPVTLDPALSRASPLPGGGL